MTELLIERQPGRPGKSVRFPSAWSIRKLPIYR